MPSCASRRGARFRRYIGREKQPINNRAWRQPKKQIRKQGNAKKCRDRLYQAAKKVFDHEVYALESQVRSGSRRLGEWLVCPETGAKRWPLTQKSILQATLPLGKERASLATGTFLLAKLA